MKINVITKEFVELEELRLWSRRSKEVHGLQFPTLPGSGAGEPCPEMVI